MHSIPVRSVPSVISPEQVQAGAYIVLLNVVLRNNKASMICGKVLVVLLFFQHKLQSITNHHNPSQTRQIRSIAEQNLWEWVGLDCPLSS
jgi:hypothetical protein